MFYCPIKIVLSYLTRRIQNLTLNDTSSGLHIVAYEVPQGSTLDPMLL
jgi:hypothetical protein